MWCPRLSLNSIRGASCLILKNSMAQFSDIATWRVCSNFLLLQLSQRFSAFVSVSPVYAPYIDVVPTAVFDSIRGASWHRNSNCLATPQQLHSVMRPCSKLTVGLFCFIFLDGLKHIYRWALPRFLFFQMYWHPTLDLFAWPYCIVCCHIEFDSLISLCFISLA